MTPKVCFTLSLMIRSLTGVNSITIGTSLLDTATATPSVWRPSERPDQ
jgi:hypothetical protein